MPKAKTSGSTDSPLIARPTGLGERTEAKGGQKPGLASGSFPSPAFSGAPAPAPAASRTPWQRGGPERGQHLHSYPIMHVTIHNNACDYVQTIANIKCQKLDERRAARSATFAGGGAGIAAAAAAAAAVAVVPVGLFVPLPLLLLGQSAHAPHRRRERERERERDTHTHPCISTP